MKNWIRKRIAVGLTLVTILMTVQALVIRAASARGHCYECIGLCQARREAKPESKAQAEKEVGISLAKIRIDVRDVLPSSDRYYSQLSIFDGKENLFQGVVWRSRQGSKISYVTTDLELVVGTETDAGGALILKTKHCILKRCELSL